MITRAAILAEAQSWRGTPHQWQQSHKGRACDCKGLVVGVGRALGHPAAASRWAQMRNYRRVDSGLLLQGMEELFEPIPRSAMRPADVLVLLIGKRPIHMAILGDGEIIHSYSGMIVCGNDLPEAFNLWPFHSAWGWKGVA